MKEGKGRGGERKKKREREKKEKSRSMITPAYLFLLLLPGGVQETLPLPFLLRCHVSVPVGLHIVHPARSVSHVPSNAKSLMSHDFVTTLAPLQREKNSAAGDETRGKERGRKNRVRTPAREPRTFLSTKRPRETLDRRSICVYRAPSQRTYVRSLRSVTASRVAEEGEGVRDF